MAPELEKLTRGRKETPKQDSAGFARTHLGFVEYVIRRHALVATIYNDIYRILGIQTLKSVNGTPQDAFSAASIVTNPAQSALQIEIYIG